MRRAIILAVLLASSSASAGDECGTMAHARREQQREEAEAAARPSNEALAIATVGLGVLAIGLIVYAARRTRRKHAAEASEIGPP